MARGMGQRARAREGAEEWNGLESIEGKVDKERERKEECKTTVHHFRRLTFHFEMVLLLNLAYLDFFFQGKTRKGTGVRESIVHLLLFLLS